MGVREAVTSVLGSSGDEAVLDYVAGVLEDEDFEWGEVGAGRAAGRLVRVWVLRWVLADPTGRVSRAQSTPSCVALGGGGGCAEWRQAW